MTTVSNIFKMNLLGKNAKFHHVGMVVADLSQFAGDDDIVVDKKNGVKVFLGDINGFCLEIVEPIDKESPAYGPLKNQQKLYHLAFTTTDLKNTLIQAKRNGFIRLWRKKPAKALKGKGITWLYSKKFGLIELIIL